MHFPPRPHGRSAVPRPAAIRVALLSFTASCVVACTGALPADSRTAGDELRRAALEWDRLFDARRAEDLAMLYAEEALSMPFNRADVRGRQALLAEFESFFAENDAARHETAIEEILVGDGWGIERARYTLTFMPKADGQPVTETGRHVMHRRMIDGRWQIVWEIFNTDQREAPAAPPVTPPN
jgi:ketosteroid isomerase-like protein